MTIELKPNRSLDAFFLAITLATANLPAHAQNAYGVLKDTPAEKFNDEDSRLFGEASKKALNVAAVGETVSWANPATKSQGDLEVQKEFTWKDKSCRQIRVYNESHGRKATNSLNFCKVADKWQMVSPSELEKR